MNTDVNTDVDKKDAGTSGILYICGTPIGNLADISDRVRQILGEVDLVAAEDTRHTGLLLQHLGVSKPLLSYHEHNEAARTQELLQRLQEGRRVALVSDAGMPGVSDPGERVVAAAIAAGIPVVPVPGPTAAIVALAASGLPTDRFVFEGFLPRQGRALQDRLAALADEGRTMLLYESPHRLQRTLRALAAALGGDRPAVLARELTKMYEEFVRGNLLSLAEGCETQPPRGEYVIVVAGRPEEVRMAVGETELKAALTAAFQSGLSLSEAVKQTESALQLPHRTVYRAALALQASSQG